MRAKAWDVEAVAVRGAVLLRPRWLAVVRWRGCQKETY